MQQRPNIIVFIPDAMQAEALEAGHPCQTPNFDAFAARGLRFERARTCTPICSPARASLMTGLLPHNHGVLEVEHCRDPDQCNIRLDKAHWAQRLSDAGYHTGYFGKWHVERSNELAQFGWQEQVVKGAEYLNAAGRGEDRATGEAALDPALTGYLEGPAGYRRILHYAVTDAPVEQRYPGTTLAHAEDFIARHAETEAPWACCLSFSEPNEALILGRDVWDRYGPDHYPLPANMDDDLSDRPALYRRERRIAAGLDEAHWRAARACYYGRIVEMDRLFGRLMDKLEASGQIENTVVLLLSDHGRYIGAHGFDAHNIGAFEEIYRIPMIAAGPGIAAGVRSDALVNITDCCPTICELGGAEPIAVPDSRSFAQLLADPASSHDFHECFAEYHGSRFPLMQRVLWRGDWKFVFNGFDEDELYNLADDPHETENLAADPRHADRVAELTAAAWAHMQATGDRTLLESHYFSLRLGAVGPEATV